MKAILRQIRISPKKASLVACLVKNKPVDEALNILKFTPKKGAAIIKKVLDSAVSNAVNNSSQSRKNLFIKEITVTKGITYKRSIPVSRGRAYPLLKRTSHITVYLESNETSSPAKAEKAKEAAVKEEKAKKETRKKTGTSVKAKVEKKTEETVAKKKVKKTTEKK